MGAKNSYQFNQKKVQEAVRNGTILKIQEARFDGSWSGR